MCRHDGAMHVADLPSEPTLTTLALRPATAQIAPPPGGLLASRAFLAGGLASAACWALLLLAML